MSIMSDFSGGFEDFEALFLDAELENYVIRFYHTDERDIIGSIDGHALFKVVIGYTMLDDDILLHLVDAEGVDTYDEICFNAERYGVSFQLLSTMIGTHGFEICPIDQLDWDDDDDDDDDCDCACNCGSDCEDCEGAIPELLKFLQKLEEELTAPHPKSMEELFGESMVALSVKMLLDGMNPNSIKH